MISIPSSDGVPIPTVFWPRAGEAKPKDEGVVLVDVHGGPHLQQYRRWEVLASVMNEAGIDVISPNYRGSEGYGYRFESASDLQTQIRDVIAACKYARSIHGKSKVILMGISYGALLAATVASVDQENVSGVVLVSMIGRTASSSAAVGWKRPLRCFHGENDPLPPDRARTVLESFFGSGALRAKDSQWNVIPGEGHVFRLTKTWTELYSSILEMRDQL
jgi:acetyl esterase/lipase